MSVIIGGGLYRSRVIEVPSYLDVPTKSVVRLAVGNALAEKINNANVLDLFAGSGAVGIELISRGATHCVFVDENQEAATLITSNLQKLNCACGEVISGDAINALETLAGTGRKFDIVFIDPPYAEEALYGSSVQSLLDHDLLSPGAVVVVEYQKEPVLPLGSFARYKTYNYGKSHLLILWRS